MRSILPLLLAMVLASASTASAQPREISGDSLSTLLAQLRGIPIADARRLPLGTVVTVVGSVSVPSGVNGAGFAVSDGNGGIYVDADSTTRVDSGSVRVIGRLAESHGLLRIVPSSVHVLSNHSSCSLERISDVIITGPVAKPRKGESSRPRR